jgi:hypothetical protein
MSKTIALLAGLLILLLPVDPAPAGEQRVEVFGDLARARDVAVIVPGSDVDGRRFDATVGKMARSLHAEAPGVAVVAWLGYPTPQGLGVDAATGRLARAGAAALTEYVRTLPVGAHVHLLCHSYGTVVCSLAAPDVVVDDIVFTGSPGVRADSVADLRTSARVWAARGADDWTRWVPKIRLGDLGHGTDPTDPAFGARVFDTGDAREHNDYYRAGTESLRVLARISTGDLR